MPSKETQRTMSPAAIAEISDTLNYFLKGCDITYPHGIRLDYTYRDACYADAIRRGFDLNIMGKALDVGIAIGDTGYRHLENYSTRVFIAVWTALLTHIDDAYETYAQGLEEFFDRFLAREPQRLEVLDQLATTIHELPHHWGVISSNLITATNLDYLTSTILDRAIEGMEIRTSMAPGFPQFTRRMTGISRAYCVMIFPAELDIKTWIQVTPDLMHYIDHTNDLFSFFKEELAGEEYNYVSMSAATRGLTKLEALRKLAEENVQCYTRASKLLASEPAAWKAFRGFCVGYVGFHALSLVRYNLNQLNL